MFKENCRHENGVKKSYNQNKAGTRMPFIVRQALAGRGANINNPNHKLERKISKCYPRGSAWLRIVDLHTVQWLTK